MERDYKNKEDYIAFRAEDGTRDNLITLKIYYDYPTVSHLLRMMITRVIQLHGEGIYLCNREEYNKVVEACKNSK